MNKTIDTLKKHNRIILFIFAAIEIITGLFSFSTVVVIDGINNILFGAYSLKKQNKTDCTDTSRIVIVQKTI